jgi:hypothetical protein
MSRTKQFFTGLKAGMKSFGTCVSTLVNTILLCIVYILGVGVTAIIAKISRKRFLDMDIAKNIKSHWKELNLTKKNINEYYRQF